MAVTVYALGAGSRPVSMLIQAARRSLGLQFCARQHAGPEQ